MARKIKNAVKETAKEVKAEVVETVAEVRAEINEPVGTLTFSRWEVAVAAIAITIVGLVIFL